MATTFIACDLALQLQDVAIAPAVEEFRGIYGKQTASYADRLASFGDALRHVKQTLSSQATSAVPDRDPP